MALTFPNINPVAFSIGSFQVHWYALAYMAGFILGWRVAAYICKLDDNKYRPNSDDIDDFMSWAIAGVILGGRIGYILFYNLASYIENPLDIFKLWQGGMSFHGGVIGVITVTILYSKIKKVEFFRLTDIFAVAAPIGFFFGRLANFVNGELFGRVTDSPLGMIFPRGGPDPRYPSQLFEAFFEGLVLFTVLFVMIRIPKIRNCPGIVSAAFMVIYGLSRFGIEFLREPDVQLGFVLGGLSMGQILCVPMLMGGAGIYMWAKRHNGNPQSA